MSKVEAKVFTDKLEALRDARGSTGKFFETYCVEEGARKPLYVVAQSEYQANLALVQFLMPLNKLDRKQVDRQYIAILEDMAKGEKEEATSPAGVAS